MNLDRYKKIKNKEIDYKMPYNEEDIKTINGTNEYKKEYLLKLCRSKQLTKQGEETLLYEYLNGTRDHYYTSEYIHEHIYKRFSHNEKEIYLEKARIYICNKYRKERQPSIHDEKKQFNAGDIAYDSFNFPYAWTEQGFQRIQYFKDALEN